MRWSARLAAYRSYRDAQSRDAMRAMGVDTARDEVYPDLAFALPAPPASAPSDAPGRVCVGVMDFHGGNDDRARAEEIYRRYLDGTTRFVRALVEEGRPVRLLTGDAVRRAGGRRDPRRGGLADRSHWSPVRSRTGSALLDERADERDRPVEVAPEYLVGTGAVVVAAVESP